MRHPAYPYLIIAKNKHENSYYLVTSDADREKAGVAIVKYWVDSWYFQPYTVEASLEEFIEKKTEMKMSDIQAITTNPSLANIQMKLGKYYETNTPSKVVANLTKEYNYSVNHNKNCEHAKNCIANQDGTVAWKIIRAYEGGEYQRIEERSFDRT